MPLGVGPRRPALTALLLPVGFAACAGYQSALDPAGPAARTIGTLTWVLTGIAAAVSIVVVALSIRAVRRPPAGGGVRPPLRLSPDAERIQRLRREGRRRDPEGEIPPDALLPTESDPEPLPVILDTASTDRRAMGALTRLAIVLPAILIAFSFFFALVVHRSLALGDREGAITIEVIGHQWWWEVNYLNSSGERVFATANEIHVPVGVPVRFRLGAGDVIHSFWVPRLGGKVDMIPGRTTWLTLQADRPGTYRGQCAEYCDGSHAHMGLLVIAQPGLEFDAWVNRQNRPATPPADPLADAGREVFLRSACVTCHTVRGTPALGTLGPDLTHLSGRATLLAAMVPNRRGYLGGLIGNPSNVKPHIRMPPVPLGSEELLALLHYLESLD